MKNTILLFAFLVASSANFAQSFFEKLEDMDGVDAVIVTKDAFEMLSKFQDIKLDDNGTMKVFSLIKDLQDLKIFTTTNADNAEKMEKIVLEAIKTQKLTELMRLKEQDTRIKIYVKATKDKSFVSEVLMFVKGVQTKSTENIGSVVISLTGTIDINKIAEVTDTIVKKNK